jgi:hypothetical protein
MLYTLHITAIPCSNSRQKNLTSEAREFSELPYTQQRLRNTNGVSKRDEEGGLIYVSDRPGAGPRASKPTCPPTTSSSCPLYTMIAHDPGWFDGQIHALSRTKAVLELLLRKTDAELISLKIQRNARSPPCRLPNELLIRIFALAQVQDYRTRGQMLLLEICMPLIGWWRVQGVCSRFHDVIVDAPELWTRFNAHWPEETRRLCLLRANGRPLRVLRPIMDASSASDACHLLQTSQEAALVFDHPCRAAAWAHAYLTVLHTHTSSLRSLGIRTDARCRFPVLQLTPPLLAHFTHLSQLQIQAKIHIDDAFLFLPSLTLLSVEQCTISVRGDRVRRLFQGLPCLKHFEALRCHILDQTPVLQRHNAAL